MCNLFVVDKMVKIEITFIRPKSKICRSISEFLFTRNGQTPSTSFFVKVSWKLRQNRSINAYAYKLMKHIFFKENAAKNKWYPILTCFLRFSISSRSFLSGIARAAFWYWSKSFRSFLKLHYVISKSYIWNLLSKMIYNIFSRHKPSKHQKKETNWLS